MLVEHPCSLLDEVSDQERARFSELARDWDGAGGKPTAGSRCEARLALTLERRGILQPEVSRPPWGDVRDGNGQVWDIKAPRSKESIIAKVNADAQRAGRPGVTNLNPAGAYDLETELRRVRAKQMAGFGVVFDLRRLHADQALELVAAVDADPEVDLSLVRFFPADLQPFST